ncbi:hypothetical protein ACSBR2_029788 [Camellia fascicularis]
MEGGGWKPVIRRRPVGYQQASLKGPGMFTVFVDNLPESMEPRGLFNLFSNYGVVKNVAASVAVQKAEGLWCDDKELKVRIAAYGSKAQNLKMQESRKESNSVTKQRVQWKTTEGVKECSKRGLKDVNVRDWGVDVRC